ncbi:hypothetical protein HPP92_011254 [Vanilla planifolia]|uniref:SWI/SNF complex subunit SWI3A n=1 Tax=Vanilla planifolia TaxID=51239 RepID=A0A835R0H9_VANPL|nr:hypothetical protein HPP92_011254 [Vanilla planifolia]
MAIEADLSTPKARERELYTIPISSSWFRWDDIHETERKWLPEFFDGSSYSRSPRVYKEYRDFIINKYRENPSRRLTFTEVRKSLVGDVGTLRKVFLFLERWDLINFSASDGKERPQQPAENGGGPVVVVEDGPAAGVRVIPAMSSSSSAATEQPGGDSGCRLPPLASYSDSFGDWRLGSGLDVIAICPKCSNKDTGNAKVDEASNPNDHVDEKNKPSSAWTDAEILLLLEAVLKHGDDWDLVAQHVRTKNKLDCIARLIRLPFGEHMLGMFNTKFHKANLVIHPEEPKSSLQLSNENPPILIETDAEQTNEIVEVEGTERASQVRPSKRRCFSSFTDTSDKFMNQQWMLQPVHCVIKIHVLLLPWKLTETRLLSPSLLHSRMNSRVKLRLDMGMPREINEQKFGSTTFRIRAAITTALAVAAARAKLLADQEEREAELLMASIIQAQLKKVQYKMKLLAELEVIMEKELCFVKQQKEHFMEEWFQVLEQLFRAGIPRWREKGNPKALLHTIPS